jgi:hypothetical protein
VRQSVGKDPADASARLQRKEAELIYEPVGNKRRLAGVEHIVDAATWLKNNNNTPQGTARSESPLGYSSTERVWR